MKESDPEGAHFNVEATPQGRLISCSVPGRRSLALWPRLLSQPLGISQAARDIPEVGPTALFRITMWLSVRDESTSCFWRGVCRGARLVSFRGGTEDENQCRRKQRPRRRRRPPTPQGGDTAPARGDENIPARHFPRVRGPGDTVRSRCRRFTDICPFSDFRLRRPPARILPTTSRRDEDLELYVHSFQRGRVFTRRVNVSSDFVRRAHPRVGCRRPSTSRQHQDRRASVYKKP